MRGSGRGSLWISRSTLLRPRALWRTARWMRRRLLDHRYIQIKISLPQECSLSERPRSHFPRWVFGRFNKKLAKEAALAQKWVMPRYSHGAGVEMLEGRIHNALSEVCNAAMSKKWRPLPGIRVAEPQLVKVLGESRAWKKSWPGSTGTPGGAHSRQRARSCVLRAPR